MSDNEHATEPAPRPPVRVNITLPPEVDELLQTRAKAERRSKSAHVAWLIERDAAAQLAEPQGA